MAIDNKKNLLSSASVLRLRAEERVGAKSAEDSLPQDPEVTQHLVHELEVHQVELEMQNAELREARYEIEVNLEKYTNLYDSAPVGDFTLDRSGSITAVNLVASNLMRIERSLLPGRLFVEFIKEEFRPAFNSFLDSVFTNRKNDACKVVLLDNVGLPISVQVASAISASGEECRLALIDISGQIQNENRQHIYVKNMQGCPAEGPEEIGLGLSVCSLRDTLDDSLLLIMDLALKGGVAIHLSLDPEADERIVTDKVILQQILYSLLSNAVRFTPAGGTVDVTAVREADFIKITVADSGVGIKAEEIAGLFQPFTQEESVYTKGNEGSGLGLTLTMKMVELLGGKIRVESQFGSGSRFSFTMPLRSCTGIT